MSVVDSAGAGSARMSNWTAAVSSHEPVERRSNGYYDAAPLEPRVLLDRLAATEARERTLIAEAIHDDPLQIVIAAIMHIDLLSVRYPAAQQDCDTVNDMLESAVDKFRSLIVATSAPNFDGGLASVLRRLAAGIFVGTPIAVHLTGAAHVSLTAEAQLAAYRIVREALVNVRKHSFGRQVSIQIVAGESSVVIRVADDGVGCEQPPSGGGHLGLPTMRSRARAVDGRVKINGVRGCGTTVTLTLPTADPRLVRLRSLRVFLVDDQAAGRQNLADLMEDEEDLLVVGQASSVADALEQIPLREPDVLITDVRLRDGEGAELYTRVLQALPLLSCLMLTSSTDGNAASAAIRAGASGYLLKDGNLTDVIAAIRAVARGQAVLDGRITAMLAARLPH